MTTRTIWKRVERLPVDSDDPIAGKLERIIGHAESRYYLYGSSVRDWAVVTRASTVLSELGADRDALSIAYTQDTRIEEDQVVGLVSLSSAEPLGGLLDRLQADASDLGPPQWIALLDVPQVPMDLLSEPGTYRLGGPIAKLGVRDLPDRRYRFSVYSLSTSQSDLRSALSSLPKVHFEEGDNLSSREEWFKRRSGGRDRPPEHS